ncbi:cytochrome c biogenesis CcdA family protein [Dactylosporangium sp. CA-092794]|uniref:cytochrome c biogenesis CcdA family protein n=1 Tax=Dactylosporangium sp. CA-092794 TaxID=3239929 RepID=UPI003D950382
MPVALAFLAGGLAILNPCSFAMLPVFLSYYVGAQERELPSVSSRTVQALLVGLTVTIGFLSVFTVLGLPITLGAGQIARAVPWVGFCLGLAMAVFAAATLAGKRLELSLPKLRLDNHRRRPTGMAMFGVAYGLASLSCTLPIFLVIVGAALTNGGPLGTLAVFGAYAAGMALVLVSVSMGAALLREGIARALKRVLPRLRWINGSLLLFISLYLLYYWGMALFASAETRAADPVVTFVQRSTSWVESWVNSGAGRWPLAAAAIFVAVVASAALWRWVLRSDDADADSDGGSERDDDARTTTADVRPDRLPTSTATVAVDATERDIPRLSKSV